MSLLLSARDGDPQAVKVLIAAEIAGRAVDVVSTSSSTSTPFPSALTLNTDKGTSLSEPNSIAKYIGMSPLFCGMMSSAVADYFSQHLTISAEFVYVTFKRKLWKRFCERSSRQAVFATQFLGARCSFARISTVCIQD